MHSANVASAIFEVSGAELRAPKFEASNPCIHQCVGGCDLRDGFFAIFLLRGDHPEDNLAVRPGFARRLCGKLGGLLQCLRQVAGVDVESRGQELDGGGLASGKRLRDSGERRSVVSLQLFNVGKRGILSCGVVGHLACRIGGCALRQDFRCIRIFALVGGKVRKAVSGRRHSRCTKGFEVMVGIGCVR